MSRKWTVAALTAALASAFLPFGPASDSLAGAEESAPAPKSESFSASVPADRMQLGERLPFVFVVDRWMTREEGRALATLQAEKGTSAVFERLAAAPAGRVRAPGPFTRDFGSGEIYLASVLRSPFGGRTVRLLTRMRFLLLADTRNASRNYGDQLGLVSLELDEKGAGIGGTLIPATVVPIDSEGRLSFDPTPFPNDTYELVGVGTWTPAAPGKARTTGERP